MLHTSAESTHVARFSISKQRERCDIVAIDYRLSLKIRQDDLPCYRRDDGTVAGHAFRAHSCGTKRAWRSQIVT